MRNNIQVQPTAPPAYPTVEYIDHSSEVNRCTKYTLFISNFIFSVVGFAVVALSTWLLVVKNKKVYDVINVLFDLSLIMCIIGVITTLLSLIGCWGSLRENTKCISVYKYMLTLLVMGEIVLMVLVFIYTYVPACRETLKLFPAQAFQSAMKRYGDESKDNDAIRYFIDNMHMSLHCCGLANDEEGYKDWESNPEFGCNQNRSSRSSEVACSVPSSCCHLTQGQHINVLCGRGVLRLSNVEVRKRVYTQGCLRALDVWMDENGLVVGGIILAILLPQIIILLMTSCLINQINRQKAKWFD